MKTICNHNAQPRLKWWGGLVFSTLLLFLAGPRLSAQEVALGTVVFGQDQQPVPGYPVRLVYEEGEEETITNEEGFFAGSLISASGDPLIQVSVFDLCTGLELLQEVIPDSAFFFFHLCTNVITPPEVDGCEAYFTYEQISFGPDYQILFQDLSFTSGFIDTIFWVFGDGTTSTENEPVHSYDSSGVYPVTLTIVSDTCQSTFTQLVTVLEDGVCGCDAVYIPTCVIDDNGETRQYSNPCEALCAGYSSDSFIPCVGEGCECPEYYDPVCVVTAVGDTLQFSNPCFAACDGFGPNETFFCYPDSTNCGCPDIYDPVCVLMPNGLIETFNNACEAICQGLGEPLFVECEPDSCVCPDIYAPVCVLGADGVVVTFGNECEAACAGYGPNQLVDCENPDPCICPEIYLPVCVVTAVGDTLQFPNACFAICEGYSDSLLVQCEVYPPDCQCDDEYWPVCTYDNNGEWRSFPNMCTALCEGYDPAQLFPCDGFGNPCDTLIIPIDSSGIVQDTIFIPCDTTAFYCQAEFIIDYSDQTSLEVVFEDHSFSLDGEIVSWKWDFGDGQSSEEQSPVHLYDSGGVYEVWLSIESSTGCSSTIIQHICIGDNEVVEGPECQAIFFFEQLGENAEFQFMDVSLGDVIAWQWNFGDGETSQEPVPIHQYTTPGVYLVTLTVETTSGCQSSMSVLLTTADNIQYEDECRALFLPFIDSDSLSVFFLNLSSADAQSILWDFGDGSTSTEFTPAHYYASPGVYTVVLTLTTAAGCESSYSTIINLDSNDFTASPSFRIVSNTEEVEEKATIERLMPNPVQQELTLVLAAKEAMPYQLQVFNIQGKLMKTDQGRLLNGENRILLGVNELPAGMYVLRLRAEGSELTRKFVKE